MSELQYTTVDRVFATLHRNLKGTDLNEADTIEWIGEALDQLKVAQVQEQAVAFMEVKDHHAEIPQGFQMVLQIARHNDWTPETKNDCCITPEDVQEVSTTEDTSCTDWLGDPVDCNGNRLFEDGCPRYIPYFDMQWQYIPWTSSNYYKNNFTPVRLANNVFFKSLVCQERSPYRNGHSDQQYYQNNFGRHNQDEYTIVGNTHKRLRFSFREGYIALAYTRSVADRKTGYPLIPDNISYITAINYYVKWKIAEMMDWNGREGYARKAEKAEALWEKYCRQAKNWAKMPKSIDDFQDLLEQSHYLIPRQDRYYNYFGNLGRPEDRKFNDPDHRNRHGHYYLNNLQNEQYI